MVKSLLVMPLICVGLSGCPSATKSNVCDGFAKLQPKVATAVYLLQNDRGFADQVGAHNEFGKKRQCWD